MTPWAHRWNVLALTVLAQALVIGIQTYSFSPILAGLIRDLTGSYTTAFLVAVGPLIVAMVAMQWLSDESPATELAIGTQR